MLHQRTTVFLLIIKIFILQALSRTINVGDIKVFDIALDDFMNYDEESENEMIQSVDLQDLKRPLEDDEERYKSLHSHVKSYNEAEDKKPHSNNVFFYMRPSYAKEMFNLQEDKPFIAGFKHDLDKTIKRTTIAYTMSSETINRSTSFYNKRSVQNLGAFHQYYRNDTNVTIDKNVKSVRIKREETTNHYGATLDRGMDFFQVMKDRDVVTSEEAETTEYFVETEETYAEHVDMYEYDHVENYTVKIFNKHSSEISIFLIPKERSTLADTEGLDDDEESYDYERFKMEYEQQLEYSIKSGKVLNYTEKEELEEIPKEELKRITNLKRLKNCTKEELSKISIKALECLLYDFQYTKDVNRILSRTWLILKVWLLIYICLAIPCWCQRGWCCCCFRCKFCFPRKRITFAKQYYAINPPGVFVKDLKKEKDAKEAVRYEASEYEYNTYETFETAIRNI